MERDEAIIELKDLKDYCRSTFMKRTCEAYTQAIDNGIEALEDQRIGRWIKDWDSYSFLYDYKIRCHCSICGNEKFFIDRKTTSGTPCIKNCDNVDKYCSNCGAKMENGGEKE